MSSRVRSNGTQMVTNEGTIKHLPELFPACAVTRAILQAESSNTLLEPNEGQEATQSSTLEEQLELADIFLGHLLDDFPTSSSISAVPQVNESNVNSALSQHDVIKEQADDSEIQFFGRYGMSEKEDAMIPYTFMLLFKGRCAYEKVENA